MSRTYGLRLVLSDGETFSGVDGGEVLMIDGEYFSTDDCMAVEDAGDFPVDVVIKRILINDLLDAYEKVHGNLCDMYTPDEEENDADSEVQGSKSESDPQ